MDVPGLIRKSYRLENDNLGMMLVTTILEELTTWGACNVVEVENTTGYTYAEISMLIKSVSLRPTSAAKTLTGKYGLSQDNKRPLFLGSLNAVGGSSPHVVSLNDIELHTGGMLEIYNPWRGLNSLAGERIPIGCVDNLFNIPKNSVLKYRFSPYPVKQTGPYKVYNPWIDGDRMLWIETFNGVDPDVVLEEAALLLRKHLVNLSLDFIERSGKNIQDVSGGTYTSLFATPIEKRWNLLRSPDTHTHS